MGPKVHRLYETALYGFRYLQEPDTVSRTGYLKDQDRLTLTGQSLC